MLRSRFIGTAQAAAESNTGDACFSVVPRVGQITAARGSRSTLRIRSVNIRLRRLAAALATLAVAWTALWPLIGAAHMLAFADAVPLCHQAGMQVAADEPADEPGAAPAAPQPAKQHCPLCIMAFLAMPSSPDVVAADRIAPVDLAREFRDVVHPANLSTRLPESRAPPASFLA